MLKKIFLIFICSVLTTNLCAEATSSAKKIKIGVIAPLSGEYAALGIDFVRSIEMAVDDFQKDQKIKIELIVENDEFLPRKGVIAARKLLEIDQVDSIINLSTPSIGAIYQDIVKNGLPVMQLGQFEKANIKDNIFILQPDANESISSFAKFVKKTTKGSDLDLFYFEDPDVLVYANLFKKIYGNNVNLIAVGNQLADIKTLVLKSAAKKHKYLVFGLTVQGGPELIKNFLRLEQKPQFFSLWDLEIGIEDYYKNTNDPEVINNIYYPTSRLETDKSFIERFKNKHKVQIQPYGELGYDAAKILLTSYSEDRDTWLKNIQKYSDSGVSGKIAFNENGLRLGTSRIMQVKDLSKK